MTHVYEGEGMPDDEVETVEEEEGKTKEDIEANAPPVETKPKPVNYSTPSIEGNFYMCLSRRSRGHSLLRLRMQPPLCVGPRQTKLSSLQTQHSTFVKERKQ